MLQKFALVEGFQVSGLRGYGRREWRSGLFYFVDGMRRGLGSVTYRPKLSFSTQSREPRLPSRTVVLHCYAPDVGYFAYGDSDRADDVAIATHDAARGIDLAVDDASANVLTALRVLATSRGSCNVAIRLRRLVGDRASFHLWTDGSDLRVAAVGVLRDIVDAGDYAQLRLFRPACAV